MAWYCATCEGKNDDDYWTCTCGHCGAEKRERLFPDRDRMFHEDPENRQYGPKEGKHILQRIRRMDRNRQK